MHDVRRQLIRPCLPGVGLDLHARRGLDRIPAIPPSAMSDPANVGVALLHPYALVSSYETVDSTRGTVRAVIPSLFARLAALHDICFFIGGPLFYSLLLASLFDHEESLDAREHIY